MRMMGWLPQKTSLSGFLLGIQTVRSRTPLGYDRAPEYHLKLLLTQFCIQDGKAEVIANEEGGELPPGHGHIFRG